MRDIADDLGVERGTLRHWLDLHGTGKKTAADGTLTRSPLKPRPRDRAAVVERPDKTPAQTIDRLQTRARELKAQTTRLATEREILRSADSPVRRTAATWMSYADLRTMPTSSALTPVSAVSGARWSA